MHGESSLQLIALTGGTEVSNNTDLNIKYSKIVQYLFSVHITGVKIRFICLIGHFW